MKEVACEVVLHEVLVESAAADYYWEPVHGHVVDFASRLDFAVDGFVAAGRAEKVGVLILYTCPPSDFFR